MDESETQRFWEASIDSMVMRATAMGYGSSSGEALLSHACKLLTEQGLSPDDIANAARDKATSLDDTE